MQPILNTPFESVVLAPVAERLLRENANANAIRLAERFARFLRPVLAQRPATCRECYRIRHEVYCEEMSVYDKSEDHLETDACDEHALQALVQHIPSGKHAGTVRVVYSGHPGQRLPIERNCLHSISSSEVSPGDFPRETICEISRLAIRREFRRNRRGLDHGAVANVRWGNQEMRSFAQIASGLFAMAIAMTEHYGLEHCFVMMNPVLARRLEWLGIELRQIGEVIKHHGDRAPYYLNSETICENLRDSSRAVFFENICVSLDEQYEQLP